MKAWEAEGREITHIARDVDGTLVTDYYEDDHGDYWYEDRGIVNGKCVSMDVYIFGHEIKRKEKKREFR